MYPKIRRGANAIIKYKTYQVSFSGKKVHRLREIVQLVVDGGYTHIFEPFGGSGCIGINLKANGFVERAVINDYDYFIEGLPALIELRKRVQRQLDEVEAVPAGNDALAPEMLARVRGVLETLTPAELKAVSQEFAHSARANSSPVIKIDPVCRYYKRRLEVQRYIDYEEASRQVELTHLDWRDFIEMHRDDINGNRSLLVLDPPYLNSAQKQYGAHWFGLAKSIELLNVSQTLNCDILFFNMVEEDTRALLGLYNFGAVDIATKRTASGSASNFRDDVMAYIINSVLEF